MPPFPPAGLRQGRQDVSPLVVAIAVSPRATVSHAGSDLCGLASEDPDHGRERDGDQRGSE